MDGKNWVTGSGDSFVTTGDGEKSVFVRQTDVAGNQQTSDAFAFTLKTKALNTAPVFTSAATFEIPEKQTAISTLSATDKEGDAITYSLASGNQFTIDAKTGALALKTPMLFDAKNPASNSYAATVSDDKGASTTQNITVNVLADLDGDGKPNITDSDIDNDGLLNSIEDSVVSAFGTEAGDGNEDGIRDSSQLNVASIPIISAATIPTALRYASLEVASNYTFSNVVNNPAPTGKTIPSGVTFPLGKFTFKINNVPVGGTIDTAVYVDSSLNMNAFSKLNYVTNKWTNVATGVATFGTKTKISFSLTDGGTYDGNRVANGVIVDPGAPVIDSGVKMTLLNAVSPTIVESDGILNTSGKLTGENLDQTQIVPQTAKIGAFGTFNVDEAGNWSYATNSAHNEFLAGKTYTDTFEVGTADGAVSNVTINIAGTKDTPILIDDLAKQVLSEAKIGAITQNVVNGQIGLQTAQGIVIVPNTDKSWTDLDLQPVNFTFQGGTTAGTNLFKTTLANGSSLTINTVDGSYLYVPNTSANIADSVDNFKVSVGG